MLTSRRMAEWLNGGRGLSKMSLQDHLPLGGGVVQQICSMEQCKIFLRVNRLFSVLVLLKIRVSGCYGRGPALKVPFLSSLI